jgi:hypothetical protein
MTIQIAPLENATIQRELPPLVKQKLKSALGQAAADVVEFGLETALTSDSSMPLPPLVDPELSGTIIIGGAMDSIGLFGALPTGQPRGADQDPIPPVAVQPMTYVGTPDTGAGNLGDTGNVVINDQMATLAVHINDLINEVVAVNTLVSRLRADLVTLGLIRGSG